MFINKDLSEYLQLLLKLVFLTGPMAFLTLRPLVNIFLVDLFIIIASFVYIICAISSNRINIKLLFVFFLITIGYVFSGVFSLYPEQMIVPLIQYLMIFVLILMVNFSFKTEKDIEELIKLYLIGMTVSILVSYLIYFDFISMAYLKTDTSGRFNGVWGNPNIMAKEMISFISLLLCLLLFNLVVSRRVKFLYVLLISVSLYLILTSSSFGGLLFLFMAVFFIFAIKSRHMAISGWLMLAVFVPISILIISFVLSEINIMSFLPEKFVSRVLASDSIESSGSAGDKLHHIIYGLQLFFEQPLVGFGLESGKYYNVTDSGLEVPFHSFYITVMVEGGLFSVIGFLFLFYLFYSNSKFSGKYRNVFICMLLVMLINLIINNNIFTRHLWFPFLLLSIKCVKNERAD